MLSWPRTYICYPKIIERMPALSWRHSHIENTKALTKIFHIQYIIVQAYTKSCEFTRHLNFSVFNEYSCYGYHET